MLPDCVRATIYQERREMGDEDLTAQVRHRVEVPSQKFGGVMADTISAGSSPMARALCGRPES